MDIFINKNKNSGRLTKDNSKIVELDTQYSLDIYDSTTTLRKFSFSFRRTLKRLSFSRGQHLVLKSIMVKSS